MKIKKILAFLLTLSLIFNFTACGNDNDNNATTLNNTTTTEAVSEDASVNTDETDTTSPSDETTSPSDSDNTDPDGNNSPDVSDGITPLLFKVTDADGNVVWLFGSIHIGKEYFYPLPDYVLNAYASADALAVELDAVAVENDYQSLMTAARGMLYSDRSKISDHISEELYNDAKAILEENGMYAPLLDYYKPVFWSSAIDTFVTDQLGYDSNLGIDYYFLNEAYDDNKPIYEVESMEFQMNMLFGFSDDLQSMMLESSVESYNSIDEYEASMDALVTAWATGDEDGLVDDEEYEFESAEEEALYNEYNTEMLTKRNRAMTDFAENALASGEEVFIVVGAAHVVGEDGMANQLRERGYTVEVIQG